MQLRTLQVLACGSLLTLLIIGGCVSGVSPVTGEKQLYGYSWQQETQMGAQADEEILAQFGNYENESLQQYVNRIGQQVLQSSDMRAPGTAQEFRETNFTFRVLDSPVVNAFALPGGYIYITRGLLAHVENEAQLAVVLGHEIAHVAARHASRRALKARAGQIGLLAGAVVGSQVLDNPQLAQQALQLSSQVMQLLFLKYSRDDERESDELGVKYASNAGYKVDEAADFFGTLSRLSEKAGQPLPSWQSTHPDPGERQRSIPELASRLPAAATATEVGRDQFLAQVDGMLVGIDPREGYVEDNMFYHPDLRFKFPVPAGWHLQNQKAMVLLQSQQQDAVMVFQIAQGNSASEAGRSFESSKGVNVQQSGGTTVSGHPAYAVTAVASGQSGDIGILQYFIEHNNRVFGFGGMTQAVNFNTYRPRFENIIRGFETLTQASQLNVSGARLRVITADRSVPFREFLPRQLPWDMTAEDAAIMNQLQLAQHVERGRKLKIPGK